MALTTQTLQQITSGKFSLEFLRARLVQQCEVEPMVYSGPGSVVQDENGALILKIYHLFDSSSQLIKEVNSTGFANLTPGKLIDGSEYFSLEGTDLYGAKWTATDIWASTSISFPTGGAVITAELHRIQTTREANSQDAKTRNLVRILVPGKYKIPTNKIRQDPYKLPLSVCELILGEHKCTLAQIDSYLEITLDASQSSAIDDLLHGVLESLGVAFGRHIRPQIEIVRSLGERREVISSRRTDEEKYSLPPPIPTLLSEDAASLEAFLVALSSTEVDSSHIFGYCYRVLRSFSGDVENSALVLTTSVEGLLKSHFENFGRPDDEFLHQIANSLPFVKLLTIGERAKSRILRSLAGAKSSSPKNALFALAESGIINRDLAELWVALRNKSAHADELNFKPHEFQQFLDSLHGCLELFYRLIFQTIGYKGRMINYSRPQWPESNVAGDA